MVDSSTETAARIAAAATAATQGNIEPLENALAELKPSAQEISHAIRICTVQLPGYGAARELLAAQLQLVLAQEQIAAQERMTKAANWLAVASLVLGAAALVVTLLPLLRAWFCPSP